MSPHSSPLTLLPRHSIRYAQNFLRDSRLAASLLDTCALTPDSVVYEIGPGKGILTGQLALRCQRVVAIENDPRLTPRLRRRFANIPNVTIVERDFLGYPLPREPYQVVANIPFNITSAIVTQLTLAPCPPENAYLIMQREAAENLVGRPRESLRALLLQPWFKIEIVRRLRRSDFTPAPRVDIVMLRLRKRGPPLVREVDQRRYRDFVTHVFTAWKPTVEHSLRRLCTRRQLDTVHKSLDFDLTVSPTSLTFERWLALFAAFQSLGSDRGAAAIDGSAQRLKQHQGALHKIHRTRIVR
jgi:23S rRNA (adenine-N6)-dimethyltransferase